MPRKERPKTTAVEEAQILDESKVPAGEASAVPRPPVRERARTALYQRSPLAEAEADAQAQKPRGTAAPRRAVGHPAHRAIVESCPFPLFQLDTLGNLLWGNAPFGEFVREPVDTLWGQPVSQTRLGVVYAELPRDVEGMVGQVSPPTVKRIVTFEEAAGVQVSWMCWLSAETNPFGDVLRIFGFLHPYGAVAG